MKRQSSIAREPNMTTAALPFPVPVNLALDFVRVRNYWESLKRGDASMPFWDDVNLSSLPDLSERLMLVDVFENPQRFRFNSIGQEIRAQYGAGLASKFLDEIEIKAPFDYLTAQSSATIEGKVPTFYASFSSNNAGLSRNFYGRLLLPMWGNGRIEMMLGTIASG
jgi:hypothetical protein